MNDLIGLTQGGAGCTHKTKSLWVCICLTHRAPNDDLQHFACHYGVCNPHIDLDVAHCLLKMDEISYLNSYY